MSTLLKSFQDRFLPKKQITPGIYHYISPQDDPRNYRLHLRVENDGSGVLIINASTILHLNQTAAEYAYYLVNNLTADVVASKIANRYDIDAEIARRDYQALIDRIQILVETTDLDPVTFLDFDRQQPFTGYIPAPYRLDCALTYKLPADMDPENAPLERVEEELTKDDWLKLIDNAMDAGIPHLVFTGGEPTLREDLPELLMRAEENNQVTGLLTEGLKLADQQYLDSLLQTGLDHLMLILYPDVEVSWQALENVLEADLYVAVHLTLGKENLDNTLELVKKLASMGVKAVSLSTSDPEDHLSIETARDYIADLDVELIWNLPVPYSSSNPVAFETAHSEDREGAGRAWLYVEPDGDVLPAQGVNRVLGNFIKDSWDQIWMKAHST